MADRRGPASRPPEQPEPRRQRPGRSDRRTARQERPPRREHPPRQEHPPRREPAARGDRRRGGAPRRRKRSGAALKLLAMLMIVAVFLAGMAIFFKVTDIQVTGSQLYSEEEVAQASGIEMGDNLITLRKPTIAGRLQALLPYVENVHIRRVLPNTVVIEVTESDAAYAVQADDGTSWLVSSAGKVLEPTPVSAADYPRLLGLTIQAPEPGSTLTTEQTEGLQAAEQIMSLLEETDYISSIREIDVSRTYDLIIWYGAQYEIHLGGSDQLEYKIQYLTSILDQLSSQQSGVIDLTLEEKNVAIFKQWPDETGQGTAPEPPKEPAEEPDAAETPENSDENS